MSVLALPSSPNWYCSRAIDISNDGIMAFASRQDVVLMRLQSPTDEAPASSGLWPFYAGTISIHKERVTAVAFSPFAGHTLSLVTAGDDLLIALTDVLTLTTVTLHTEHKGKPTCVCWMRYDLAIHVVSGDESGRLISVNIMSKKTRYWRPARGAITDVSNCPQKPHIVAIGYQTGLILIVDLQKDAEVTCSLRHHDADVQSVCWAPFDGPGSFKHLLRDYHQSEHLLASSSRDRTIRVWSTRHGTPILNFSVPSKVSAPQRRQKDEHMWITVVWPKNSPDHLLSSSPSGAMLTWDLLSTAQCPWSRFGRKEDRQHSRAVFNVACYKDLAVSISMDRQIIFWQLSDGHQLFSLATLGGFAYCLHFSPINSGVLAVGCGDCMLRTWNLTTVDNPFDIATFWQGVKSKVTSLAWHPKKEGIVAYGTEEGRVGVCSVLTNKPSTVFVRSHRRTVYSVAWGPACPTQGLLEDSMSMRLYSCGDGIIYIHDPKAAETLAPDLNDLLKCSSGIQQPKFPKRMEIAWNDDFTILTLGNIDGSVELYAASSLQIVGVISSHVRLIHCLRWHPNFTLDSTTPSSFRHWLAVAAQDPSIHIHDLTSVLSEQTAGQRASITTCGLQLVGHGAAITSIAWNPHLPGQLVSASFDHTVRVWNVIEQTVIACFCGHSSRVLCAEWSPLKPDLIVSGGEDFTVQIWKISEQDAKPSAKVSKAIEKMKSKISKKVKPVMAQSMPTNDKPPGNESDPSGEIELLLLEKKKMLLEQTSLAERSATSKTSDSVSAVKDETVDNTSETGGATYEPDKEDDKPESQTTNSKTEVQQSAKKKRTKKKSGIKSLFPLSSTMENRGKAFTLDDCVALVERASDGGRSDPSSLEFGVGTHVNLGMYGGRVDAYRLLKTEANHHLANNNLDYALQLEVWKGNIVGALKLAGENEQLSDWLVSLAATVSPSFWSEMCEVYVRQLVSDGHPHKAVLYLLANHKVHEAVEVLKTHVSYKEAVILAKVRLSPKDPLILCLMDEWAEQLQKEGNVESAAKCLLAAGHSDLAAAILSRKREAPSSRIGAYIAARMGCDPDTVQSFGDLCMRDCLITEDYVTAEKLISDHPQLKMFRIVMRVLQHLNVSWRKQSFDQANEPLLDVVIQMLENHEEIEADWKMMCDVLLRFRVNLSPQAENEVITWLAVQLSTYGLRYQMDDHSGAQQLLLEGFVVVHKSGNVPRLVWLDRILKIDISAMEKSDPVRPYLALARLHTVFDGEKSRLSKTPEDCERHSCSACPCGEASTEVLSLLDELLNEDRAELARLRTRLTFTKVALASVLARSKGNSGASAAVSNTNVYQIPADRLIENLELTVADLQIECNRLEELLTTASTKTRVSQFPEPFETVLLLAELCAMHLQDGCQCPQWTDLLRSTVTYGHRCIALQRQTEKLAHYEAILEVKSEDVSEMSSDGQQVSERRLAPEETCSA